MGNRPELSNDALLYIGKLQMHITLAWLPTALVFVFIWFPLAISSLSSSCPNGGCDGFEGAGFQIAMIFVFPILLFLAVIAILITVPKAKRIRRIRNGLEDADGKPLAS